MFLFSQVARATAEQALSWAESDDTGAAKGGLKIVVVENMFRPQDFEVRLLLCCSTAIVVVTFVGGVGIFLCGDVFGAGARVGVVFFFKLFLLPFIMDIQHIQIPDTAFSYGDKDIGFAWEIGYH